jgi:hypothetical protein
LTWNSSIRQTHRWLSVAFTAAFIIVSLATIGADPAEWVYLLPLPPLFLLLITGLYLFALPYVAKWRGRRRPE